MLSDYNGRKKELEDSIGIYDEYELLPIGRPEMIRLILYVEDNGLRVTWHYHNDTLRFDIINNNNHQDILAQDMTPNAFAWFIQNRLL